MFTGNDFENMGKAAASEYIGSNKDLSTTITKIATHYGLNSEQIARVVEQANVETYLKLNNVADDKYIEFAPADNIKVASALNFSAEKKAELVGNDFEIELDEEFSLESPSTEKELGREKVAEDISLANGLKKISGIVNARLEEIDANFDRESETLYKIVKQAALEAGNFGIVKQAMLSAAPDASTEMIADVYEFKLKKEGSRIDFEKSEAPAGVLNSNHPLVQSLNKLATYKDEYAILKEFTTELEKDAGNVWNLAKNLGSVAGSVGKIIFDTAKATGSLAVKHKGAAAAVIAVPAVYGLGKARGRNESSKANTRVNKDYVQRAKNLRPL